MHKQRWTIPVLLLTALLAGGISACGDKDKARANAGDASAAGESIEQEITAADGGTVELKNAGIKLDIPAGALDEDTTITAAVLAKTGLPKSTDLAGNVVEFGPNGLKFKKPVSLSIDLGGETVPKDATVAISWLNDKDEWVDLEGSKLANGAVTAETTHFTIFAIRIVRKADGTVVQEGGMCAGTWKACGGDPSGTWKVVSGCADVPASLSDQFAASCPGAEIALGIDVTGDITLKAGKITGTLNSMSEFTQTLPKSCKGGSCGESDPDAGETVTEVGDNCVTKQLDSNTSDVDGTYTVDGNTITIVDNNDPDAGTGDTPTEFCVTGDTMIVHSVEGNDVVVQWTAKRQ